MRKLSNRDLDHCDVPSNFALDSSIISLNRTAPLYLLEKLMDYVAVIWSWLDVYPFSFTNRNRNGRKWHSRLWLWLCLRNKFHCNSVLIIFKGNGFWRFAYVFVNSVHNSNPRYCSVSKQRFDHDFDIVTSLMKTDFHIQGPGRLSCFRESTLSLGMLLHFECDVYSRHRFFISSGPSSSSGVMKNCPFSTIFKPASQHSLDIFWSSGSCSNLCS